ncbi:hypothetical protein FM107_02535 [Sphingobacterium sp. JB170]|nr:hypothetical protein FM107_02535 [Sphingobacterium sp. JB170]
MDEEKTQVHFMFLNPLQVNLITFTEQRSNPLIKPGPS